MGLSQELTLEFWQKIFCVSLYHAQMLLPEFHLFSDYEMSTDEIQEDNHKDDDSDDNAGDEEVTE